MKHFKNYLLESKDRFFLKNKNLTPEQQQEFIKAVKKYKNFETLINNNIGWNKVHNADYETINWWLVASKNSKNAKKNKLKKLRHKGIKGLKEGEDYISIKMKNIYYLAYLPLHAKAAQILKTEHIGGCTHNGCIGSSAASKWFKKESKNKKRVPVYVVGQGEKYVVMLYPDNKNIWETWRKENKVGESGEIIPDFSIKKELTTPRLMDLYKDVLYNTWMRNHKKPSGIDSGEYEDAVEAYEAMISGIEEHFNDRISAMNSFNNDNEEAYNNTIEQLNYKIEELNDERDVFIKSRSKIDDRIESIKRIIKVEPTGTGVNSDGEIVWNLRGVDYTLDDLHVVFKNTKIKLKDGIDEYNKSLSNIEDDIREYKDMLNTVIDFGSATWEFIEYSTDHYKYEEFDNVQSEENIYDSIYTNMDFNNSEYDDYFDYASTYMDEDFDRSGLNSDLYDNEYEIVIDGSIDGDDWLSDIGVLHPEEAGD